MNETERAIAVIVFLALLFNAFAFLFPPRGAFAADDVITVTGLLKVDNGDFKLQRNQSNYKNDQAGTASDYVVQVSTNNATNQITLVNVTDPGYCWFRNTGPSNGVFVSLTMYLKPGDFAILPAADTNITHYTTNGGSRLESWANQK